MEIAVEDRIGGKTGMRPSQRNVDSEKREGRVAAQPQGVSDQLSSGFGGREVPCGDSGLTNADEDCGIASRYLYVRDRGAQALAADSSEF